MLYRLLAEAPGMKPKLLTLFTLGYALLMVGCAFRRVSHDYMFDVTGMVIAEDRAPLQDVEVTLEVDGPVYAAITPVKTVKHLTNGTGGFMFMYISHERGVKYTLTVHKDGFEPQSVSGSSPPAGNHVIRLKRVGGDG
jgi:hypothetical protein